MGDGVQDETSDVMTEEMVDGGGCVMIKNRDRLSLYQFGCLIKLKADLTEKLTLIELARKRAGAATWNLNWRWAARGGSSGFSATAGRRHTLLGCSTGAGASIGRIKLIILLRW